MDGWNTTFLLGRPIFRCYVSFREGNAIVCCFCCWVISCLPSIEVVAKWFQWWEVTIRTASVIFGSCSPKKWYPNKTIGCWTPSQLYNVIIIWRYPLLVILRYHFFGKPHLVGALCEVWKKQTKVTCLLHEILHGYPKLTHLKVSTLFQQTPKCLFRSNISQIRLIVHVNSCVFDAFQLSYNTNMVVLKPSHIKSLCFCFLFE